VGDCYHLRLLCRASGFAERPTLGKEPFAEGFSLPSAALDKERLCRVPDIWHSAKLLCLVVAGTLELLQQYFLANEQRFSLTTYQYKLQRKSNFSETNRARIDIYSTCT
jgi:hypothetical protein